MVSTNTFCFATSPQNVRRKTQYQTLQSGVWAIHNERTPGYLVFKVPPLLQLCAGMLCSSIMYSRTFWKTIGESYICEPYPLEKCLVFVSVYDCISFCFYEFIMPLAPVCISNRRDSLLKSLDVSSSIWGRNQSGGAEEAHKQPDMHAVVPNPVLSSAKKAEGVLQLRRL